MKVVICGARDWDDEEMIRARMKKLPGDSVIITGGASGADTIADAIAKKFMFSRIVCNANWERYGRAAGPIRNREMLEMGPDLVIAFKGKKSKGTQNTITQAKKMGIEVEIHMAKEKRQK